MFDTLCPKLVAGLETRKRSDGSVGIYQPRTGRAVEASVDQAPLFALIDGQRSLSELAAEHLRAQGFVPFSALRDLLAALAANDLLENTPAELTANGLSTRPGWMQRLGAHALFTVPLPLGRAISIALAVVGIALCADSLRQESADLEPWDVVWTLVGAMMALTARGIFKAAAASIAGAVPTRLTLSLAFGIPFLGPDSGIVALVDRWPRAVSHAAALVGSLVAVGIGTLRPGLWLGALVVLLVDLCPFAPTSMGKLLATLSGRVDLREHVRAYLTRRLLRRVASARFFAGERDLILSGLLSLAWISLIVRLLLTDGVIGVLSLLALGLEAEGLERGLAYGGAAVLAALMPISLGVLVAALLRAVLSLRSSKGPSAGSATGASVQSADFRSIPLFSRLGSTELEALAQKSKELRFGAGLRIVVQGAESDYFFAIRSGEVVVEVEDDSGLLHEVTRLTAGDCFGETALLERGVRGASVRPVRETVVAALSRADFESLGSQLANVDVAALLRATAALKKSAFFAHLPAPRQGALAMRLTPRLLRAGDVVVREGDKGEQFFLVAEGQFEVLDAQGAKVSELGPGDHFGEVALLRDVPRTATVRAVGNATVLVLQKNDFIAGIAADLGLSARLEGLAGERVGGA